jgi:hypothetical protein
VADPRTIVRSSNQQWDTQVAMAEAEDRMDYQMGSSEATLAREQDRLNPVIYLFAGAARPFRRATNPYV